MTGRCSVTGGVGDVCGCASAIESCGGAVIVAVGAAVTSDVGRADGAAACVAVTSPLASAFTMLSSSFGEMPLISSMGGRPISSKSSSITES